MVTVIVLTHNSRQIIGRCLSAVRALRFDGSFEALVVDDSTDGTAGFVERDFPEVRVLRLVERLTIGAKRNLGVRAASGQIVAFTDSDCAPAVDWLAQLEFFHRGDAAVVGGAVAPPDEATPSELAEHLLSFHDYLPGLGPCEARTVPTCNAAYKKQWLTDSGLFPDADVCEDVVANSRIRARGGRVLFRPEPRVVHHPHYRRGSGAFLRYQGHLGSGWVRARKAHDLSYSRLAASPLAGLIGPARLLAALKVLAQAGPSARPYMDPRVLSYAVAGAAAFGIGGVRAASVSWSSPR